MAMGTLTAVADDVKLLVSNFTVLDGIESARGYVPLKDITEMSALTITVVPRAEKRVRESRKSWLRDFTVDVAVQQKVDSDEQTDELTALVETLASLITDSELATQPVALLEITVVGPDPGHLNNKSLFTTIITATYRGRRHQA